ncbi:MAG: hypothetical protein ACI8X5_002415 [Planctomycetota bacterium]
MPANDPNKIAQELLTDFLAVSHQDTGGKFKALCTVHPGRSSELRDLFAAHRKVQEILGVFGKGRGDQEDSAYSESPSSEVSPTAANGHPSP